jgi:hypothetical protein
MTFIVDGTSGLTFPNSTVQASAGSVLQVVQTVITGTTNTPYFSTTTNGLVDTGFTASITPKFANSKILVLISPVIFITGTTTDGGCGFGIKRNSTNVYATSFIAFYAGSGNSTNAGTMPFISYLDSPATTSSTSYQFQINRYTNNGGSLVYLNRNYVSTDISTITLMEIAG